MSVGVEVGTFEGEKPRRLASPSSLYSPLFFFLLSSPIAATPNADESAADRALFLEEALAGLTAQPKTLPSKYFYDRRGSEPFDQSPRSPNTTRRAPRRRFLREHLGAIAARVGRGAALLEYGSGSSEKTRLLLDRLAPELAAYVPIDISAAYLADVAEGLRAAYPRLAVLPVAADYTGVVPLPELPPETRRRVVFSRLHHRQLHAGRGGGLSAPRRRDGRPRRRAAHRHRSQKRPRCARSGLRRCRRRDGRLQQKPARPSPARARRRPRRRRLPAPRGLERARGPGGDAPRKRARANRAPRRHRHRL